MSRTWKVLRWDNKPDTVQTVELACACGSEADVQIGNPGALIIARLGMSLVFDVPGHVPPRNFMPDEIQCRKCGRIYADKETEDVR